MSYYNQPPQVFSARQALDKAIENLNYADHERATVYALISIAASLVAAEERKETT